MPAATRDAYRLVDLAHTMGSVDVPLSAYLPYYMNVSTCEKTKTILVVVSEPVYLGSMDEMEAVLPLGEFALSREGYGQAVDYVQGILSADPATFKDQEVPA